MNNKDRKQPPIAQAKPVPPPAPTTAAADSDQQNEGEPPVEVIMETFPASDAVSPFVPEKGVVLDGTEVELLEGVAAGIEQAGSSAPEQIDPGGEGPVII